MKFESIPWHEYLAFVTILGLIWRFGISVIHRIEKIASQFVPNGGSTLRDAIDRVERSVAFSEKRSRISYDLADSRKGIFETDASGACTHVSNSWCTIHQMQRDEALGWGILNALDIHDQKSFELALDNAIEGKRSFDYTYRSRLGRSVRVHAEKVVSATGAFLGYIGQVEEQR